MLHSCWCTCNVHSIFTKILFWETMYSTKSKENVHNTKQNERYNAAHNDIQSERNKNTQKKNFYWIKAFGEDWMQCFFFVFCLFFWKIQFSVKSSCPLGIKIIWCQIVSLQISANCQLTIISLLVYFSMKGQQQQKKQYKIFSTINNNKNVEKWLENAVFHCIK